MDSISADIVGGPGAGLSAYREPMAAMKSGPVEVVVVCHNSQHQLIKLIDSLGPAGADLARRVVTLVDCGSDDPQSLEEIGARRLIRLNNIGFGAAANVGALAAESEWIALVNPDCRVAYEDLIALADYGDRFHAVLVGPHLLNNDGVSQPPITRLPGPRRRVEELNVDLGSDEMVRHVMALCGAVLVLRRQALIEIGGFDWGCFMYGEELDLAARLYDRGRRTVWVGAVRACHLGESGSEGVLASRRDAERIRGYVRFVRRRYGTVAALASLAAALGRRALSRPATLAGLCLYLTRDPRRGVDRPSNWNDAEALLRHQLEDWSVPLTARTTHPMLGDRSV
jgi:N-acetylglucosaminyl-diphospho-decaprenol L-rhamnosyltransferase